MAQPDADRVRAYFAAVRGDPESIYWTKDSPRPPVPLPILPQCAILAPVPSALPSYPDPSAELCCICVEPMDGFPSSGPLGDIVKSKVRPIHR